MPNLETPLPEEEEEWLTFEKYDNLKALN